MFHLHALKARSCYNLNTEEALKFNQVSRDEPLLRAQYESNVSLFNRKTCPFNARSARLPTMLIVHQLCTHICIYICIIYFFIHLFINLSIYVYAYVWMYIYIMCVLEEQDARHKFVGFIKALPKTRGSHFERVARKRIKKKASHRAFPFSLKIDSLG